MVEEQTASLKSKVRAGEGNALATERSCLVKPAAAGAQQSTAEGMVANNAPSI